MSTRTCSEAGAPRRHAARAFLIAPGIAALVGALASLVTFNSPFSHDLMGRPMGLESSLGFALFLAVAFAVVGYATTATVGVLIYLVLPEKARSAFAVVVPLAGAIAAAPWIVIARPWQLKHDEAMLVWIPFALGAVAGVAFLFLRRPRAPAQDPREAAPDRPARADAL